VSKGGAAQPAPVDPTATAAAQTASNVSTAQTQAALNNSNTFSPFGSSIWTPTTNAQGQTTYSLNQNLSPQLQQLFGGQTNLASLLAGTMGPQAAGSGYNLTSQAQGILGGLAGVASQVPTNLNLSNVAPITQLSPGSFQTNVAQGPIQTGVNSNFPQLVQQAQNAAYQSQTQYLDPQFQQAQSNLTQQLADQGIQEGTPAYSRAMLDFNNQKQQAYQSAQDQAVAAGNQQEQSLFGQSLAGGQFANQAQAQQFGQGLNLADLYNQAVLGAAGQQNSAVQLGLGEAQAQAQQPINALQALLGAGTGMYGAGLQGMGTAAGMVNAAPTWPSIPTYGGQQTTVPATSYSGIDQAAAMANSVANQAFNKNVSGLGTLGSTLGITGSGLFGGGTSVANAANVAGQAADVASMWGGGGEADVASGLLSGGSSGGGGFLSMLPGLIGTAAMFLSDRRAKTDIRRVGTAANGLPLYRFRFRLEPVERVGVMADEVEAVRPDAVLEGPGGFKMVDYRRALSAPAPASASST
jgi:hypothetical protein